MKVDKRVLDNGRLRLVATAAVDEVEQAFTHGLSLYVANMGLGSVEGETPEQQIAGAFGDQGEEAIVGAVMDYLLPFALTEAQENPLIVPKPVPDGFPVKGRPFTMIIDMYPKPQFELNSYEPVEITVEDDTVTDQDINEQIIMIADSYATEEPDIMSGGTRRVSPEVTDEWVAENIPDEGVNTVEELREKLRQASEEYRDDTSDDKRMEQALCAITERLIADIPGDIVDATIDNMINELKMQLSFQGMTFESYLTQAKSNEKYLRKDLAEQARVNLTRGFALDAVFRHESMTLNDDDLLAALRVMGRGNEKEMLQQLRETGRMFMVEEAAARMKAGNWVLENARVAVAP